MARRKMGKLEWHVFMQAQIIEIRAYIAYNSAISGLSPEELELEWVEKHAADFARKWTKKFFKKMLKKH